MYITSNGYYLNKVAAYFTSVTRKNKVHIQNGPSRNGPSSKRPITERPKFEMTQAPNRPRLKTTQAQYGPSLE